MAHLARRYSAVGQARMQKARPVAVAAQKASMLPPRPRGYSGSSGALPSRPAAAGRAARKSEVASAHSALRRMGFMCASLFPLAARTDPKASSR